MELMMNIALCLVVAILLGFLIGWYFAKTLASEEYDMEYNELNSSEDEYSRQIRTLESKYEKEHMLRKNEEKKSKDLKFELMKKVTLLKNTTDTLEMLKSKDSSRKDDNKLLKKLEKLIKEKNAELVEFESVLVKAEKTIEELKKRDLDKKNG